MKKLLILTGLLIVFAIPAHAQASNRYKVTGPVKAYRLETAKLTDLEVRLFGK
jgi:hypothetical protein